MHEMYMVNVQRARLSAEWREKNGYKNTVTAVSRHGKRSKKWVSNKPFKVCDPRIKNKTPLQGPRAVQR